MLLKLCSVHGDLSICIVVCSFRILQRHWKPLIRLSRVLSARVASSGLQAEPLLVWTCLLSTPQLGVAGRCPGPVRTSPVLFKQSLQEFFYTSFLLWAETSMTLLSLL